MTFRVKGKGAAAAFADEAGGHRWQRVPPTEKRGRVQTSTVTVAVMTGGGTTLQFNLQDVTVEAARGHGKGGQHRNKTESAIRVTHRPTGLTAYAQSERSQHHNRASALSVLQSRVHAHYDALQRTAEDDARRGQVGSGMRGDKRRTVRLQDGRVHDHVTGRWWRAVDYLSGQW